LKKKGKQPSLSTPKTGRKRGWWCASISQSKQVVNKPKGQASLGAGGGLERGPPELKTDHGIWGKAWRNNMAVSLRRGDG